MFLIFSTLFAIDNDIQYMGIPSMTKQETQDFNGAHRDFFLLMTGTGDVYESHRRPIGTLWPFPGIFPMDFFPQKL